MQRRAVLVLAAVSIVCVTGLSSRASAQNSDNYDYSDVHFHLTNYVQKGPDAHAILRLMGNRVGRSTLFGIPLQQMWSHANSADYAPTYYLQTDAPLYYYSFTDAFIAMQYRALTPEAQRRFDPMITGFNPSDMYAVDHIRRTLLTFPGVFTGIGEFSIHKEFVSSKVAGEVASLTNPALDSILAFAGESGLVVLLHNDIDMPFAKEGAEPVYLTQTKAVLRRHPNATIIWAHAGLGRVVHPVQPSGSASAAERSPNHVEVIGNILSDPAFTHVHFDISWDEVAKYVLSSPEVTKRTADLINRFPDRFLFGSDVVAPTTTEQYFGVYEMYRPLWVLLTPEAREKTLKGNYARLFDSGRQRVRAWERANRS